MIIAKLDVSKIDKTKLFKGTKGVYMDVILIPTPKGKYGDYLCKQGLSKEDREAGQEGAILGNAKDYAKGTKKRDDGNQEVPVDDGSSIPF